MQTYLNSADVALPIALYLATDNYDRIPGVVSATQLMKSTRQQVLVPRVPAEQRSIDIINLVKSRMGSSIHDGVERAWSNPEARKIGLRLLGYSEDVIESIVYNPEQTLRAFGYDERSLNNLVMEQDKPNQIPMFMEIRSFREIEGREVSGKFDLVGDGRPHDFKSTGTFTWTKGSKDEDYQIQLSIYRWLNPKIITEDSGSIHFFFTDWKAWETRNPAYPQKPIESKEIPLLSLDDTEDYIRQKLQAFDKYKDASEQSIPVCSPKELWQKDDQWKVYKDPNNLKRAMSGGTFNNPGDAHAFNQAKTKGTGFVRHIPGEAMACKYCDAFLACGQKDQLIANQILKFD